MLFELDQEDIRDVLQLIASPSLTIPATYARRVFELQTKFANAKPSSKVEELTEELEKEKTYGTTMLERWKEVSAELGSMKAAARAPVSPALALCPQCAHSMSEHDDLGCDVATCGCIIKGN